VCILYLHLAYVVFGCHVNNGVISHTTAMWLSTPLPEIDRDSGVTWSSYKAGLSLVLYTSCKVTITFRTKVGVDKFDYLVAGCMQLEDTAQQRNEHRPKKSGLAWPGLAWLRADRSPAWFGPSKLCSGITSILGKHGLAEIYFVPFFAVLQKPRMPATESAVPKFPQLNLGWKPSGKYNFGQFNRILCSLKDIFKKCIEFWMSVTKSTNHRRKPWNKWLDL